MPQKLHEDAHERRRRQNRESQQRWRQRNRQIARSDESSKFSSFSASDNTNGRHKVDHLSSEDIVRQSALCQATVDLGPCSHNDCSHGKETTHNMMIGSSFVHDEFSPQLSSWYWDSQTTKGPRHTPSTLINERDVDDVLQVDGYRRLHSADCHLPPFHHVNMPQNIATKDAATNSMNIAKHISENDRIPERDETAQMATSTNITSREAEETPTVQTAIKEVQALYTFGVRVGLLRKDERVKDYLENMRTKYQQMSLLRDVDSDRETIACDSGIGYADSI